MFRRIVAYFWASPNTLLGLVAALAGLLTGGRLRVVRGVLEVHGGVVPMLLRHAWPLKGGALAMTLGHVILGVSKEGLKRAREHEHVHVRQYERWGPLFLPAYLVAGLVATWRGQRFYQDNAFEREAYAATGAAARKTS